MMATLGAIGTVLGAIVLWAVCVFFAAPVVDWALQWWKKLPDDPPRHRFLKDVAGNDPPPKERESLT